MWQTSKLCHCYEQSYFFLRSLVTGCITGTGDGKIKNFFGPETYPPFHTTGGSGSGGGFQFHCGSNEIGGCGGGGGGGFNLVNGEIVAEVGGGGGCNIPGAELNYGCHNSNGDYIETNAGMCQAHSYSPSWDYDLSQFQIIQLQKCAASGTLTMQGGGGEGGGTANNNGWVGFGCSFFISVNGANPVTSNPKNYQNLGPVMTEA